MSKNIQKYIDIFKSKQFLFSELVKRDFKQKYKGTVLGIFWSILSPMLMLLVMRIVFTQFFGRDTPHYTTYLFCGNLIMNYFRESTKGGMKCLTSNASIFPKVNVPKYMFLMSKNVSSTINFLITMVLFFVFCLFDGITFRWSFFLLIYPALCLMLLNFGAGLILSAMLVFFKDTSYLYDVFLRILTYLSAIFYNINRFPEDVQRLFMLNPVYCYIRYFRLITIDGVIPSATHHILCFAYAIVVFIIGALIYKHYNHKFLYYV